MNLTERVINPNFGVLKVVTKTNGRELPLVVSPENGKQLYIHSLISFAKHLGDRKSLDYESIESWLEEMSNVSGRNDSFDFALTSPRDYDKMMSKIGLPGYNVTIRTDLRRGADELYTKTHTNGDLAIITDPFIQKIVAKGYRNCHTQIRDGELLRV